MNLQSFKGTPDSLKLRFKGFVYVIGLHAVQFGNNWMRKIPRNFGSPRNFLNPIISRLDKHVVVLPINYIVYYLRVKNKADFVRNILFQNIFGIQINR